MFSESKLLKKLNIMHFSSLTSTNTYLKEIAENGEKSGTVVIADTQSEGKGRMGRSFLSRNGGLYMSVLLRPYEDLSEISPSCITNITPLCAVAVCNAIEKITGKTLAIKWVNDLFYNGKKVCGILAEASYTNDGRLDYIVLGIGINIVGNFDDTELSDIATSLYSILNENELTRLKELLVDEILQSLAVLYENQLTNSVFFDNYKNRLFIIGKDIEIIQGDSIKNATVIDLNKDFTLLVRYTDDSTASLNSGEVRLKVKNG